MDKLVHNKLEDSLTLNCSTSSTYMNLQWVRKERINKFSSNSRVIIKPNKI